MTQHWAGISTEQLRKHVADVQEGMLEKPAGYWEFHQREFGRRKRLVKQLRQEIARREKERSDATES